MKNWGEMVSLNFNILYYIILYFSFYVKRVEKKKHFQLGYFFQIRVKKSLYKVQISRTGLYKRYFIAMVKLPQLKS